MTSMTEHLARDRRRGILEHLAQADGYALPAGVLTELLREGRHNIYADLVQADLVLMAQHGLVVNEELPSVAGPQTWVTATAHGLDVARGRAHPTVAAKAPRI